MCKAFQKSIAFLLPRQRPLATTLKVEARLIRNRRERVKLKRTANREAEGFSQSQNNTEQRKMQYIYILN